MHSTFFLASLNVETVHICFECNMSLSFIVLALLTAIMSASVLSPTLSVYILKKSFILTTSLRLVPCL